ncbi:MAG: FtsX-like permease family protein, partial [Bacteroidales bacterium]
NFVANNERVYQLITRAETDNIQTRTGETPAMIAPQIKANSPAIEVATRYLFLGNLEFTDYNGHKFTAKNIKFTDSSFFDIFTRNIFAADAKRGLLLKDNIMISRSFAQKLNGSNKDFNALIGTALKNGNNIFTITGIYEDFPNNSALREVEALLPFTSIETFGLYSGYNGWIDNRYSSFIKIHPNASLPDIQKTIHTLCEKNLPLEKYGKGERKINIDLIPIQNAHLMNAAVKRECWLLGIIAAMVIVSATLNYILISLSSMASKAKTIAVLKCYGACARNIYNRFLSEAFLHLLGALFCAVLLILWGMNIIEEIIGTTILSLIQGNSILLISAICMVVLIICGIVPGAIYSKIPVAVAFRKYKGNSRKWKHILLFIQFATSSLFITLLTIVIMQYNMMLYSDMGYKYDNLIYTSLNSTTPMSVRVNIQDNINNLSCVEGTTLTCLLPSDGGFPTDLILPGMNETLSAEDMICAGEHFFNVLEIPMLEGEFDATNSAGKEIVINRSLKENLEKTAGWKNGVIGKSIQIGNKPENLFTISGVYEDYTTGTLLKSLPHQPGFITSDKARRELIGNMYLLIIKLKEMSKGNIESINKTIKEIAPELKLNVVSYPDSIKSHYAQSCKFRNSIIIACIIILLITMIGLIGYTRDDTNRRRQEIALRRISGATLKEILQLFLFNILKILFPAIIIGSITTYYFATEWLLQFANKITLSWWIFASCSFTTTAIIIATVLATIYRTARTNPAEQIR